MDRRKRRQKKVRKRIFGTAEVPRLSVFRSNRYISAQLIDDAAGKTLVTESSKTLSSTKSRAKKDLKGKQRIAFIVGEALAEKAFKKKIKNVVFDRSGYKYHGRVAALAEGAREGGLKF